MGATSQGEGEEHGNGYPSSRSATWAFGVGLWARIAWEFGNAQLEILRSLLLGFQGSYFSDSR